MGEDEREGGRDESEGRRTESLPGSERGREGGEEALGTK